MRNSITPEERQDPGNLAAGQSVDKTKNSSYGNAMKLYSNRQCCRAAQSFNALAACCA
jgi:hypothetical protein